MDLRAPAEIERMVRSTVEWAGGLDVLVNNAGIFDRAFTSPEQACLEDLPEEAWEAVYDVNVRAAWLAMKHAARYLRGSDRTPAIVNVASIAGLTGYREPAYTSSKGALIQLTRSAAVNLAPQVRVNCVCPGIVRTPMTDTHGKNQQVAHRGNLIPRLGEPDELANVIAFLGGDEATFMTGAVVPVDGGTTAWRGWHD
ncbi:dihydroanticapsin 7-dehydrogenase [Rhodococcus olei]|uniref:Dihydroanticapsin 7-dehydrogenase n=1 Tax=Rhodococcus olei TaxID=2161675 RepID=A0ABP8NYA0_9NOCA